MSPLLERETGIPPEFKLGTAKKVVFAKVKGRQVIAYERDSSHHDEIAQKNGIDDSQVFDAGFLTFGGEKFSIVKDSQYYHHKEIEEDNLPLTPEIRQRSADLVAEKTGHPTIWKIPSRVEVR